MDADRFVAELTRLGYPPVPRRLRPAFEHEPDPVLDLLARYDLTALDLGQLQFRAAPKVEFDDMWEVAVLATDTYHVQGGQLLSMNYKSDWPRETGVASRSFLALVALKAAAMATIPKGLANRSVEAYDAEQAPFAARALAIDPAAAALDWFGEDRRRHAAAQVTSWKWYGRGVDLQDGALLWYDDVGSVSFAGGGASEQTFADFLADGPPVPDVPDDVLWAIRVSVEARLPGPS